MLIRLICAGLFVTWCSTSVVGDEPQLIVIDSIQPNVDLSDQVKVDLDIALENSLAAVSNVQSLHPSLGKLLLAVDELPKYWIGLRCIDPGEAMKKQLGLEADTGLLVDAIIDDSPATKAGLQRFDVLVSVKMPNEKPERSIKLFHVKQLVEAVDTAQTKPLQFELIRQGKRETVEVNPVERSDANKKTLDNMQFHFSIADDNSRPVHLQLVGPTIAMAMQSANPPEGMTIEFRQIVGQPERILVTKGDSKWEVTENDLSKLPEDVRTVVLAQLAARKASHSIPQVKWTSPKLAAEIATSAKLQAEQQAESAKAILKSFEPPKDLQITVTRNGTDPAKATIKKGDQVFNDITVKDLDKLPEDLRPYVASILWPASTFVFGMGKNARETRSQIRALRQQKPAVPAAASAVAPVAPEANETSETTSPRVDELKKRLDEAIERESEAKLIAVKRAAAQAERDNEAKLIAIKRATAQVERAESAAQAARGRVTAGSSDQQIGQITKKIAELEEKIDKLVRSLEKSTAK